MALYIGGTGGNTGLTWGGYWNSPGVASDSWPAPGNPFHGLSELTLALAIKPDSPFAGGAHICHMTAGYNYQNAFSFTHLGTGQLRFRVWNDAAGGPYIQLFTTGAGCLVAGTWNWIMLFWRGATQTCTIWNNAVPFTTTVAGDTVTTLNDHAGAPLQLGSETGTDETPLAAAYAEHAYWSAVGSDRDAIRYGRGFIPPLLGIEVPQYPKAEGKASPLGTSGLKYLSLRPDSPTQLDPANTYGAGLGGPGALYHLTDGFRGTQYGNDLTSYNYGGGSFSTPYQGVFVDGPCYFVPHPVTRPVDVATDAEIGAEPQRRFPLPLLRGHYGKRNGAPLQVPGTYATVQAAINALTDWGQTIEIDAGHTELLTGEMTPPDNFYDWPVTDATPRCPPGHRSRATTAMRARTVMSSRAAMSARKVAGEPCYVVITTTGTLPAIPIRRIPLPDGTTVATPHESARIGPEHYAQMATIQMAAWGAKIINTGFGTSYNGRSHRIAWHGIRFLASTYQGNDLGTFFWLDGRDSGKVPTWHQGDLEPRATTPNSARRWIFNQCALECDPLNIGTSVGTAMQCDIAWLAFVNGYLDKFWGLGGGDGKLFGTTVGLGPYCFTNNTMRTPGNILFTGGGGSMTACDIPSDGVIERNWMQIPAPWDPSETHRNGGSGRWTVNVSAAGIVSDAGGLLQGDGAYNPLLKGTMYAPATGYARTITAYWPSGVGTLGLNAPWPGGAQTNLVVAFQIGAHDPEDSPLLYNSGTAADSSGNGAPTATINSSTRHVALSAALPANCEVGHYFYPNFTYWQAVNGDPPPLHLTPDLAGNQWGIQYDITWAQSHRKRIAAIDSDRLGFTFDAGQNLYPANFVALGATFPYSVVRGDGLRRHIYYHYKGPYEFKYATRWTIQGNVWTGGKGRTYALDQSNERHLGKIAIAGNLATLLSGTSFHVIHPAESPAEYDLTTPSHWPPNELSALGVSTMHADLGAPWYFSCFIPYPMTEYGNAGRIIDRILTPTTVLLRPQHPRFPSLGDGTWDVWMQSALVPWAEISKLLLRYNLFHRGGPAALFTTNAYQSKSIPGGQYVEHDNLHLRPGSLAQPSSTGANGLLLAAVQGGSGAQGPPYSYGPGGSAIYDEPLVTGGNGLWRCDHNGCVRSVPNIATTSGVLVGPMTTSQPELAYQVSLRDNLVIDANGAVPTAEYATWHEAPNPDLSCHAGTSVWRGNVFQGSGALVPAFQRWTRQAGNAAVASIASVGMPAYANGATDGFNLANYALADIYTSGTVAISPDGQTVTHQGGDWPDTIVAGPAFKTSTCDVRMPIHAMGGDLGAAWSRYTDAGRFVKRNGVARPVGAGAAVAFQTNTTSLANDQWVQATNVNASRGFGLGIRCGAPETVNGYVFTLWLDQAEPWSGCLLGRFDAGVHVPLTWGGGFQLAANAVWKMEAVGTRVSVYQNGNLVVTRDTAGDATRYSSGRAAIMSPTNNAGATVGSFSAGEIIGGVRQAAKVTDEFPGGGDQLQLAAPYPEQDVSGKAFVITFKGTATDGTDPGPDLTTLAAMIEGVRDPAKAAG